MQNNHQSKIEFPTIPEQTQFVAFVKSKITDKDVALVKREDLTEIEIREIIAKNIFNTLFVRKINEQSDKVETIIRECPHILKDIGDTYPNIRRFTEKLQSERVKSTFGNKDIIDLAQKAKENGLEPLAKILATGQLSEEEFELKAKEHIKRLTPCDIEKERTKLEDNIRRLEEAILGAKSIVRAFRLFGESYWSNTEGTELIPNEESQEKPKRDWENVDAINTRAYIAQCQKESLIGLFSKEKDDWVNSILRDPFINYIEEKKGPTDAKYIRENFKILEHDNPKLVLYTIGKDNYATFEDCYIDIFGKFVKSSGRKGVEYEIGTKETTTNAPSSKKGILKSKIPLDHKWNTFIGDKLKEIVKDSAIRGRHLYIEGMTCSGKTHLLQGLAQELHETKPDEKIIYTTGADFYNEYQLFLAKNRAQANKSSTNKEKPSEHTESDSPKKKSEYIPSYVDQFIGTIFIVDGIEGIFSGGQRLRSKEAFLVACKNAKQVIISGRGPIGNLIIPRKENPIKISDEIKNMLLLDMPIPKEQSNRTKKSIIYRIFTELGDLFTQGLPLEGMANILVDHASPNDYKMIIEGYITARTLDPEDRGELSIKKYIEKKLNINEIGLPIDDIIATISELLKKGHIRETISGIVRSEIDRYTPEDLIKKIKSGNIKSDSTLGLFTELIIHFIQKVHPKLSKIELGAIIDKPSRAGTILDSAKKREQEYPLLFGRIETGLMEALYQKYGFGLPKNQKK